MQRNKLTSERYPNTPLYLAKECLGFLSKHTEVDISKVIRDNAPIIEKRLFERAIQDIERLKQIEQIYNDRLGKPIGHTLNEIWDVMESEDNNVETI